MVGPWATLGPLQTPRLTPKSECPNAATAVLQIHPEYRPGQSKFVTMDADVAAEQLRMRSVGRTKLRRENAILLIDLSKVSLFF